MKHTEGKKNRIHGYEAYVDEMQNINPSNGTQIISPSTWTCHGPCDVM